MLGPMLGFTNVLHVPIINLKKQLYFVTGTLNSIRALRSRKQTYKNTLSKGANLSENYKAQC